MAFYTSFIRLTEMFPDIQDDPAVGTDLVESSIAMAEGEVNGHVGRRYPLPLTKTCPLLEKIASEIAIYGVLTARPFTGPPRPIETSWQTRYNAAVAMLIKIGNGEMVITDEAGNVIAQDDATAGAWSNTRSYVPTFGEGPDQASRVDPNKIADELSRRAF
jgi:phage gp36-like protein